MPKPSGSSKKQCLQSFTDCIREFCLNSKNVESLWALSREEERDGADMTSSAFWKGYLIYNTEKKEK